MRDREIIYRAEDRNVFRGIVEAVGLKQPHATTVTSLEEAHVFLETVGLPTIVRPAFYLRRLRWWYCL